MAMTGDVIDFAPVLCPEAQCSACRDGRGWYRDANHISVPAAIALSPRAHCRRICRSTRSSNARRHQRTDQDYASAQKLAHSW